MSFMCNFKSSKRRRSRQYSQDNVYNLLIWIVLVRYSIHSCLNLQSDRLHKVLDLVSTVHDLCAVLGMDFFSTVTEVHPSLDDSTGVQSKSISNDTLSNLANTVLVLKEDKKQRLLKVNILTVLSIPVWFS